MLINTLLVFLKHLLPISFICVFWIIHTHPESNKFYLKFTANLFLCGLLLQFIWYFLLPILIKNQSLELLRITLYALFLCSSIYLSIIIISGIESKKLTNRFWFLSLTLLILIYVSDIQLYFISLSNPVFFMLSFFLGILMGIGICISFMILSLVILKQLIAKFQWLSHLLLVIFIAGQSLHLINSLFQMDIISAQVPLWNSDTIVSENSEWGYFLGAMTGYESTPTLWHLLDYLLMLTIPYLGLFISKYSNRGALK